MSRDELEMPNLIMTVTEGGEDIAVGTLESFFRTYDREYVISGIEVEPDYRQRGIGKIMLILAKLEAAKMGAKTIRATFVSREAIDAARAVFGADSINIGRIGTYNPPQPGKEDVFDASAGLRYELDSSKIQL